MSYTINRENQGAPDAYPTEFGLIPTVVGIYVEPTASVPSAVGSSLATSSIYACSVHHTDDHSDDECRAQYPELMQGWLQNHERKPPADTKSRRQTGTLRRGVTSGRRVFLVSE